MPSAARRVDDGRAGDGVARAPEGVVALLVGGDEEDLAAHGDPIGRWASGRGSAAVGQASGVEVDEVDHGRGQLLALVLLEEVARRR